MTDAGGFDWAQAHERLRHAALALEGQRTPEAAQALLEARARVLAQPPAEAAAPGAEPLELLAFWLAGERYAVPASHVIEVIPLDAPTRVPCTPAFVLGVVNHRGRVLPVIDLADVLAPGGTPPAAPREVIAVEAAGRTFGMAAERVDGVTLCPADTLAPAQPGDGEGHLRRATGEPLAVVDLEGLAAGGRMDVHEDPTEDHVSQGREL